MKNTKLISLQVYCALINMNNKHLANKSIITLLYITPFFLVVVPWYRFMLFAAGVILGMTTLLLDEQKFFLYYSGDSLDKSKDNEKQISEETIQSSHLSQNFLMTRSTLFLLLMVPLSLFVVSSTGSALGSGYVLGLMLGLIQEMWLFMADSKLFSKRFLSQLKKKMTEHQIKKIVWFSSAYFILINFWAAFLR